MTNPSRAMLYGLGTVLLWSTVATAFSLSLRHLAPIQLLLIASFVSFCFLMMLVIKQGQWGELMKTAKRSWKASLLYGTVNPLIYYLVLLEAYNRLPAQEAQVINYTWAIMLSFLAVPILKQRLTGVDIIAALACYLGVLIIATHGELTSLHFSNLSGVALALISTVIWALYWLMTTKDSRSGLLGLTLNFAFALPLTALYWWWSDAPNLWPTEGVLGAIYVGLFEMGVSFVLWNKALKLTDKATRIANLIFLAPILSIVWLSQIAGETIQYSTLAGLVCILVGLSVQNWGKSRKGN